MERRHLFLVFLLSLEWAGCSTRVATTTQSSGSEESGSIAPQCEPILQGNGSPSGFEYCAESDATVRESAQTCDYAYPGVGNESCSGGYGDCSHADDCTEDAFGACQLVAGAGAFCFCFYGCESDADCHADQACMCNPVSNGSLCIAADQCRSDADCDAPERCVLMGDADYEEQWLECQTLSGGD